MSRIVSRVERSTTQKSSSKPRHNRKNHGIYLSHFAPIRAYFGIIASNHLFSVIGQLGLVLDIGGLAMSGFHILY